MGKFEKLEGIIKERAGARMFATPEAQDSVYEISAAFVREVREREVRNIVLPDATARPLWVGFAEIWHMRYSGEPLPGIYFLNPDGFVNNTRRERVTKKEALKGLEFLSELMGVPLPDELKKEFDNPIHADKLAEFKERFTKLFSQKDQRVLVLDTCVHTGDTMQVMADVLKEAGFTNVLFGAVSKDMESEFPIDLHLIEGEPHYGCHPAGAEGLIKRERNITSERSSSEILREFSLETREDIRKIVRKKEEANKVDQAS
jgi:hypothetical protein